VVQPNSELAVRTTSLVLNQKVKDSLKLGEERRCNEMARVIGVVNSGVTEFNFCLRVNPVAQEMRARTRDSASSPGTMAIFPDLTSSRLRAAKANHAC
jgi:hypothetical protein